MTKPQIVVTAHQSGKDLKLQLAVKDSVGGYEVASNFEDFTLHDTTWPFKSPLVLEYEDWELVLLELFKEIGIGNSAACQLAESAKRALIEFENSNQTQEA